MNINGEYGVIANNVSALDSTASIRLGNDEIDLTATNINAVSQNFTINGNNVTTALDLQPLTEKTLYIQLPLSLNGTIFNQNVHADKFLINGDTAPPKKLYSDGSLTTQGDLIFLDSEPINQDDNRTYFDKSLNYYAASDVGFPIAPSIPSYNTNTQMISSENELKTAEYAPFSTLIITNSFNITSTISLSTAVKIQGLNQNIKLSCNLTTSMFNIDVGNVWFDNITLNNSNTGTNATIINFVGVNGVNSNGYVTNCIFETNEFAISSNFKNLQINNNVFKFVGTADSHQYIILTGLLGNCFITNNIFWGNSLTAPNTQCISINTGSANNFLNSNLIIKGNTTGSVVQRLLMVNIALTASNMSFYVSNNVMTTWQGYIMFFESNPLLGVKQIYLINNTEILGGISNTGSFGMISLDASGFGIISFDTLIYSAKNTIPLLRPAYFDLTNPTANQPRTIAYLNAVFAPGANKYDLIMPLVGNANSGAVVPVDISGLESKTQNINATSSLNTITKNTLISISGAETFEVKDVLGTSRMIVNNTNTTMSGNVTAGAFIKSGGTNQQYLMANGSVLQYSANSGNSNFYLYNSSNTVTVSPSSGQITYDDVKQSDASMIYINHVSSDNIDIEIFYSQLSNLNDVYIQDRNNSQNNIQYNISGAPTITVDSKIAIPVTVSSSQGTGTTSFGSNHPVLISFFTNSIETDTRLSNLETNKLNKNGSIIMTGNLNMGLNKIVGMIDPTDGKDATNKAYVDAGDSLKLNLTGGTMSGNLDMANYGIGNVNSIIASSFVKFGGTSSQFLKADGSVDSSVPQLYTGTFTMTWNGGGTASSSQTVFYTKIGSALGVGMVTLRFTAFSVTIGTSSRVSIVSSSPISAPGLSFTPGSSQGFQLMAVPIRFNNSAVGLGWMEINTAGNLNIYGPTIGNYWSANTANCGLNNICTVTYST